jgi:signal recognition particle GTPase
MTRSIPLSSPVKNGEVTVSTVTLRDPTDGDARALAAIATQRGTGSFVSGIGIARSLVARLSGLPMPVVERIGLGDLKRLSEAAVSALAERRR